MTLGYNDLNDLIQNQRALAELVNKIKDQYDLVQDDINFARELDTRINTLSKSMETVLKDFDTRIAESDQQMVKALEEVKKNAQELKDAADKWVSTLEATGDGAYTVQRLVGHISSLHTLVEQGIQDEHGNWTGGLKELYERLAIVESKTPSIKIMPEGTDVAMEDRLEGVLYGRITDQVTDNGVNQALRISPYLQGIIIN